MPQVSMVSDFLATVHTEYSGIVNADENGVMVVDCRDGPTLVTAGAMYVIPTGAEREKAKKERLEAKEKEDEEFAKSSAEDSKREAILSGVMEPEPEHARATARAATPTTHATTAAAERRT